LHFDYEIIAEKATKAPFKLDEEQLEANRKMKSCVRERADKRGRQLIYSLLNLKMQEAFLVEKEKKKKVEAESKANVAAVAMICPEGCIHVSEDLCPNFSSIHHLQELRLYQTQVKEGVVQVDLKGMPKDIVATTSLFLGHRGLIKEWPAEQAMAIEETLTPERRPA